MMLNLFDPAFTLCLVTVCFFFFFTSASVNDAGTALLAECTTASVPGPGN